MASELLLCYFIYSCTLTVNSIGSCIVHDFSAFIWTTNYYSTLSRIKMRMEDGSHTFLKDWWCLWGSSVGGRSLKVMYLAIWISSYLCSNLSTVISMFAILSWVVGRDGWKLFWIDFGTTFPISLVGLFSALRFLLKALSILLKGIRLDLSWHTPKGNQSI